ncbi:MAG TPA: type IV toxin-antitoxin system AbiEi family antitoxin domain-containing protein [Thermoanaerobaculia bacterium]|jgi:predicted transcriptional regulator of viral defense system|nr:type IV toxin-antitoxin system AbiEi family antitoxin domain-containing protein [Thermoanaerobaculia bacterium]
MKSLTLSRAEIEAAGIGAYFRPRDLGPLAISFPELQRLVAAGSIEKVGRGLYRLADVEPNQFETIAMVSSAVPSGIICLLSALRFHDIGTQSPREIWIALDRKARKPASVPTAIRIVRFSGPMLTYGVERHSILGVPLRITSPARTVVDCLRYRNKLGLDVALEALREAIRMRITTVDEIARAAEVCRSRTVMRPYLEVLAS